MKCNFQSSFNYEIPFTLNAAAVTFNEVADYTDHADLKIN